MSVPSRLRLLVADDAPFVRTVLARLLAAAGHDCTVVAGGAAALAAAEAERFDAILADLNMPDLDGADLLALLRTGRGPNRATPVVLVTGDAAQAAGAGAEAVLAKPIEAADLFATLTRARGA